MSLFVHAVKCGRTHTLILTNNGVSKTLIIVNFKLVLILI